ncbi:MAG: TolC family protein [Bacteroidales bacterium]
MNYIQIIVWLSLLGVLASNPVNGQTPEPESWSLDSCLSYAIEKNISVRMADLATDRNTLSLDQARASRLPSVSASVNQNFSWNYTYASQSGTSATGQATGSTSYNLNSSVDLFQGLKVQNQIKQSEINLMSSQYSSQTIRESMELNVLNAFPECSVCQGRGQQCGKADRSDPGSAVPGPGAPAAGNHLPVGFCRSNPELASEKQTLVDAQNELTMANINLMQLMEYPVSDAFRVATPDLSDLLDNLEIPSALEIYGAALGFKPQVKQAEASTESAKLDVEIAKAGLMPSLSLSAGLGTNYTGLQTDMNYFDQLQNNLSPRVGLTLAVPIFQKKQVKTSIGNAKIGIAEAELNALDTRNALRKEIEQAVANVVSARQRYLASQEEQAVTQESVDVATEKMNQGLMNAVDYLYERTNLIVAESKLLQSKYNLIFSEKVLDFYKGVPLTL